MKHILLTLFIICILVGISLQGKIIVVQLVLTDDLLPYYEWLISYPGVKSLPGIPSPAQIPFYETDDL